MKSQTKNNIFSCFFCIPHCGIFYWEYVRIDIGNVFLDPGDIKMGGNKMRPRTSILTIILLYAVSPVFAADAPDFNTFYTLYKMAMAQNDITITADMVSTRLISVPGAAQTVINGGGFGFDGGAQNGFTVSSGYTFNIENGGDFDASSRPAIISKSYNNFISPQGAVIANLGGQVTVNNVAFSENSSTYGGGVLYQNNSGTINVSDSVFDSNNTTRGDGGVLYNEYETIATFNNVVFQNNSARDYGGVIFNDGTLNISDSVFLDNTASSGAGLYNSNEMILNNVSFTDNKGTSDAGAIYTTGAMNLNNGVFENNSGATGGAIGNYGITGDTLYSTVANSTFINNSAEYGGAIYNWDDIYVIDSVFENNSATDGGGAIFNLGELYLIARDKDLLFSGNTASGISNAIHSTGVIGINAAAGRTVNFQDSITGNGEILINRSYIYDAQNVPTGGNILLGADMFGFKGNVTMYDGTLSIGEGGRFFNSENLQILGGTLNLGTNIITAQTVTFGADSTLRLDINDKDAYGAIVADAFNISSGAQLDAILAPSAMGNQDTLRVHLLRGNAPINDAFIPTINNNIYMFTQLGNGWYEIAQLSNYADVIDGAGGTQNNMNTATAWQNTPDESNLIGRAVYNRMYELLQTDAYEYIHALSALAPSPAPLLQMLATSYTSRLGTLLMDTDDATAYSVGRGKIWASGIGGGGHLGGNAHYADFDRYGFGGAVGTEYSYADFTLGASYMYQYDRLKSWSRTLHTPTHGGGIYIRYDTPYNLVLRGTGMMFYTDVHETKNAAGFGIDNNSDVYTYSGLADIGYRISELDWNFTPRIGAQYTIVHRDNSIDSVGQEIASRDLHFLTAYTGLTVARYNFMMGGITINPEFIIGASYDLRSDADMYNVSVNDISYIISGRALPRWALNSELKLRAEFNPVSELEFGLGVDLRQDYINYMAHLRGTLRF